MNFNLKFVFSLVLLIAQSIFATYVYAQACNANEDIVTFNFGAAASSTAAGSTVTWPATSTANTYSVATAGSVASNTISFNLTLGAGVTWIAGFPSQGIQGNVANSLDVNMDATAAGQFITARINFNRPMDKVRFEIYDLGRL